MLILPCLVGYTSPMDAGMIAAVVLILLFFGPSVVIGIVIGDWRFDGHKCNTYCKPGKHHIVRKRSKK